MDGSRFDALARRLGRFATRRGAVRLLSGAVIGLGSHSDHARARKRDCGLVGEPCGNGVGKPGRYCAGAVCAEGQLGGGTCACPEGLRECRGFCVDANTNRQACGPNCEVCPDEADCCNGVCCKDGQRCCEGKCTDLTADNDHCGGCGQACSEGLTCCDSRCRTFDSDPRHCGACGKRCGPHAVCANGQCVCRKGYGDCGDGACRSLLNDPRNCGACGRDCGPRRRCVRGRCKCAVGFPTSCLPGENQCGRAEDRPCASDAECCQGACVEFGGRRRCRRCLGIPCDQDAECCGGLACFQSPGPPEFAQFCGGCRGRRVACAVNEQCCSSECTLDERGSTCLSNRDGRCLSDLDCRDCFVNGNCEGACVGLRCRV